VNPHSGDSIAREQGEAGSKEQAQPLGRIASQLREKLGESLSSIKKFDAPIEQATTSSLEALKAFSRAMKCGKRAPTSKRYRSINAPSKLIELSLAYAR